MSDTGDYLKGSLVKKLTTMVKIFKEHILPLIILSVSSVGLTYVLKDHFPCVGKHGSVV